MANFIFTDSEELARIAPDLDHPDLTRLAEYISYLYVTNTHDNRTEILTTNLAKWSEQEQETYYGTHSSTADFVRYYLENYAEAVSPDWVVIDYDATWDNALRHEFTDTISNHYYADLY